MARPIWKGHISFGLINIPVTLYPAEANFDLHFRLIDSRNKAAIRYERVNEVTGEEVPWNSIVKGYEYSEDKYVLLTDEDFKHADVKAFQSVEISDFVNREEIALAYFQKPYFLVPSGKGSEKGYALLREVLKKTDKVGIAQVVIRTRQYIAALYPQDRALVLDLLRYHQELRDPSKYDFPAEGLKAAKISPKELEMAEKFVESLTAKWKPERYKDEYRESLMKWIQKKAKAHGKALPVEEEPEVETVEKDVDIMDLLKKSMKKPATRSGGHYHAHARPH